MRLIDADNLKVRLSNAYKRNESALKVPGISDEAKGIIDCLIDVIEEEPIVDPVTHGHWVRVARSENHDYAECDQFVCSNCGIELQDWHRVERDEDDDDVTYHQYEFKYCPNCGAKIEKIDKRTLKYADQDTLMSAT